MKQKFSMFAVLAVASIGAANAQPYTCAPMSGIVHLTPDAECAIRLAYSEVGFMYLSSLNVPGTCFSVKLRSGGRQVGSGSAGLTNEILTGMQGSTGTPAMLNEADVWSYRNEVGLKETRQFFTGRSVVSLRGGNIYTADAGVKRRFNATEQLIVTKGDGVYAGAHGYFFINGNAVNGWANYNGKVCVPVANQ
jgi:hypothetical protein